MVSILFAALATLGAAMPGMPQMASGPAPDFSKTCGAVPKSDKLLNPPELVSQNGVLSVRLTMAGDSNPIFASMCYFWTYPSKNGPVTLSDPPTLHVKQGDKLIVELVNTLHVPNGSQPPPALAVQRGGYSEGEMDMSKGLPCGQPMTPPTPPPPDPQTGRIYGYHRTPWNETNLHFHGLNVSPKAPSDDVITTLVCPMTDNLHANLYTYVLDIPADEPPGTYWYHPHPHGESDHQLLSGLTGVIIVDSATKSIPDELPDKVIVIRDQGSAEAAGAARPRWGGGPSQARIDWAEQQVAGPDYYHRPGGFPFQNPDQCPPPNSNPFNAKLLTVNHIPLPVNSGTLTGLPTGTIASGETDYYRFANTSSDTILDVVATVNGNPANIMVTSRDSVPLVYSGGQPTYAPVSFDHVFVPPAGRFEFYLTGTNPGDQILFTTLTIDSGCWGDITLQRNLFVVNVTAAKGKQQIVRVPRSVSPAKRRFSDLYDAKPVNHSTFAFTEYNAQGDFYITEISNPKAVEAPYMGGPPQVVVKAGTVEDWTILNYAQETHMFHMHQIHFLVLKAKDYEFGLGQLLDTVDVPYGVFKKPGDTTGDQMIPGQVVLRMDFRDKNIIGEFPFHCHILAHEDGGMMAKIRIEP